ncbi:tetratricopeptide repeat protein [Paraglaciecola sp. MB-3u-78]|uniref:tetratricopeptide repeat protein n=1 Tax=Paraglaciecola sp. MB-3u-78 TaxID=2058332 RepID=UPI0012FF3D81|nr:tetratricopeptide repeat protein [Paraglaciecola sp. MB-3u-78]
MKVILLLILFTSPFTVLLLKKKEAIDFYKDRTAAFTPLKAFNNFKELADKGSNNARVLLFAIFYEFLRELEAFVAFTINHLAIAARAGDKLAQYNLGLILIKGLFIPQDIALGLTWLEKSAAQGEISSMEFLGITYITLFETDKTNKLYAEKSIYWLRQAIKNETTDSNIYLLYGMAIYDHNRNFDEASSHIRKAIKLGDKNAIEALSLLSKRHNLTSH